MKCILAATLLLATSQALTAETTYLCVADNVVGYTKDGTSVGWLEADYDANGAYVVKPMTANLRAELAGSDRDLSNDTTHGLWSDGNETGNPLAYCAKRSFAEDLTDITCRGAYSFSLSTDRLTYQLYFNGQYDSQRSHERADSLYVETGTCSHL